MNQTETRTVTPLGENIIKAFNDTANKLSALGDDPGLYELSIAADVEFCEECHILYGGEE